LVRATARDAAIPEHWLIAAADELGVRTRRGQRWLPRLNIRQPSAHELAKAQ
jgi:hypothetical protein